MQKIKQQNILIVYHSAIALFLNYLLIDSKIDVFFVSSISLIEDIEKVDHPLKKMKNNFIIL